MDPALPDGRITYARRQGGVAAIGVDRVAKRNSFTPAMLDALAAAYTRAEADPEVRVTLLFAEGEHFTGGLDLTRMIEAGRIGEPVFPTDGVDPLGLFGARRTKPAVMAVEGFCLTLGVELLLACDISVAGAGARFGLLEVQRAMMPYGGATLRLPQLFGWGGAMRYLLTGDMWDAETALRFGMVQEVVPDGQALARAGELADRIAAAAPLAVQACIANSRMTVEQGWDAGLADLLPVARRLAQSEDAVEGELAFRHRRAPQFKGR